MHDYLGALDHHGGKKHNRPGDKVGGDSHGLVVGITLDLIGWGVRVGQRCGGVEWEWKNEKKSGQDDIISMRKVKAAVSGRHPTKS